MKSVFIAFDQAFYERIVKTLDRLNCRVSAILNKCRVVEARLVNLITVAMLGQVCVLPLLRL